MLELRNITKDYVTQSSVVHAVKGISVTLRDNEFVSILGPSGCGKTTTLNIIGGLDRYTSGDLIIDGKSTKEYTENDWDAYRNHRVGFIFQSYNLIPHQSVLSNVELALTIGNVDKGKRKALAKEALIKVGLKNEINKFPSQLSGGQMQRVAIARAIVNKPSILLADEPTGALDTKTSVQVLDILKELSKECLVVMVTHNEELAEKYSTRIISLRDGELTNDTNFFISTEYDQEKAKERDNERIKERLNKKGKEKKVGMPFKTALKLSLSNLKSKFGRTLLTCFAGSIGIIGIALVLSVSTGFNNYIEKIEASTLSQYPLEISQSTVDIATLFASFMVENEEETGRTEPVDNSVIPNYIMVDLLETLANNARYNNLSKFREYLEEHKSDIEDNIIQIRYGYNTELTFYKGNSYDSEGNFVVKRVKPYDIPDTFRDGTPVYIYSKQIGSSYMESFMNSVTVWSELFNDTDILKEQYDCLAGRWPQSYDEVVYVVDDLNEISDVALYSTGIVENGDDYVLDLFTYVNTFATDPDNAVNPKDLPQYQYDYTYEDLMNVSFLVMPESSYYQKDEVETGSIQTYSSIESNNARLAEILPNYENNDVIKLKVVGVVRPNPDSDTHSISGTIGYSSELLNKLVEINNNSSVAQDQIANKDYCLVDIFGMPTKGKTWEQAVQILEAAIAMNPQLSFVINEEMLNQMKSEDAYMYFLRNYFDYVEIENPTSIKIYPKSFEDKEEVVKLIDEYNASVEDSDDRITYTDYVSTIMGSVTTIINAITYVLIAFVSISLVVSSIMIAIITYISVLERTKEIGILRAMGASKRDVKNIFNAETFITGFVAGVLGIAISIVLDIPISMIVEHLAGIKNIAVLPVAGGIALVIISFLLSVISGLIPSSYAAKCDPVVALRSE